MTDESRDQPRLKIHIEVEDGIITIQDEAGEVPPLRISAQDMARFRRTVNKAGRDAAETMFVFGAATQKWEDAHNADLAQDNAALTNEDSQRLRRVFHRLHDAALRLGRDTALQLTYELLRAGSITRAQAAVIASDILGKEIKESTWRTAVDQWANDQGLPQLDLPRGRPTKGKPRNT